MICTKKACGGDEERMEVIDYIYIHPILIDKTSRYEINIARKGLSSLLLYAFSSKFALVFFRFVLPLLIYLHDGSISCCGSLASLACFFACCYELILSHVLHVVIPCYAGFMWTKCIYIMTPIYIYI